MPHCQAIVGLEAMLRESVPLWQTPLGVQALIRVFSFGNTAFLTSNRPE